MKRNVTANDMLNQLYDQIGQFLREADTMKESETKKIRDEIAEHIRDFVDMLTDERNWEDEDDRKDFYEHTLYEAIGQFLFIEAAERYRNLTGQRISIPKVSF